MLLSRKTYISLLLALLVLNLGIFVGKLNLKVNEIIEREKCPACFGINLCQDIDDNKVTLEYTDFYSIFNNLLGIKNIYYGKYGGDKVIIKKLAQKIELEGFDKMICSDYELMELCFNKPKAVNTMKNFYNLIVAELISADMNDPNVKIRLCPTISKLPELFSNVLTENNLKNADYYKYLWSLIQINPEPILLQILSSNDNWPTPKYFGACGRIVIVEYIGLPLSAFIQETWIERAIIASSLLDAAYAFTFKNPKFAFYLTDISMDNIAVNNEQRAIFVDLENTIIVDKYPSDEVLKEKTAWNVTYTNQVYTDCKDCFIFSPTDICNHKISDHNYYAICQNILVQGLHTNFDNQGLLHNIPSTILQEYPQLTYLLNQCSKPDKFQSRIESGNQLKKVLDTII
ncbi:PREDICTED: deleted in autism protein 1 homolog, partial [Ceratosolen solmsi marchali]|uniref:Deleted in autism protein 1 homolog n=1 Tax=Ceratosolen solmsi marchali TaxID=326594 RepID=A0AAJ6YXA1_9HYME